MTRTLHVYIDRDLVGVLSENAGIWSFAYDPGWVKYGYELSPGLPLTTESLIDTGSVRPVQWFFDNLLPEEAARSQLMATLPSKSADAWDLLAHFGAESAGALTLLPPSVEQDDGGLILLTDEALDARIQAMPRQPLVAHAPKKMSLAGAQQKLPVVVAGDGSLFEPTGARASTHVLKPDAASDHYPCSAVNEWFCARLARALGLNVPPVELRFVPSPVYIIQRFDRDFLAEPVARLHALDAAQLLSMAAGAKYAQSGAQALNAIADRCEVKLATRIALFRWTLFNILIGNSDAHLKNLSVLATTRGYELAPHYDLVSTTAWSVGAGTGAGSVWPNIAMSFPAGGAITYGELRREHVEAFSKELRVPSTSFRREFGRLLQEIRGAADTLLAEFEARIDVPAVSRAACMKMLRTIVHIPITEMARRLVENPPQ